MKNTPVAFAECAACGRPIHPGHAYVTIVRHIEQFALTAQHPDGEITVIDARELLTLCGGCGNRFNAERASAALVCPAGAGSIGMRVPDGADDGNRSRTARLEPQGTERKGRRQTLDCRNTNRQ